MSPLNSRSLRSQEEIGLGPEGRRRLAGGVSHRNRRPMACAPAGALETSARTILSPLRGLPALPARSGGLRHRLISGSPSGTSRGTRVIEISPRSQTLFGNALWSETPFRTEGVSAGGERADLTSRREFAADASGEVLRETRCSVDTRLPHPQTPPPCETEFRSKVRSQTGVWERGDYAVGCALGPEGRQRLAGGVSHRNRRPTACAPAGALGTSARVVLSPLRGLPALPARSGGLRHRLISVGPSGTSRGTRVIERSPRSQTLFGNALWSETPFRMEGVSAGGERAHLTGSRERAADASGKVLREMRHSVHSRLPHPQTPPPCETEFRSKVRSQTGVWEREDYAVGCAFGPDGRRRLTGGVSHRNRRPTACAPAGAPETHARAFLSPLRGLPALPARSGGLRHRLISVGRSGTSRHYLLNPS